MLRASLLCCLSLSGCALTTSAPEHRAAVTDAAAEHLTLGRVQKEIRVGMGGAEVAAVLGSPNIVTTDEQRREVWIYDRFATESVRSASQGGIAALILGSSGNFAGVAGAGHSQDSGAVSHTQRTFTVVIKFDTDSRVRDFSYRTARF